ncbi:DUF4115 domain-containing protein [Candidatus Synechococcus calcipolaris G9]|uniref:DUF4115 domain-containing protein n=1 Tax=Candidatus Synechococcus calcipolaris G9 TaxID=1497997 RepID=A0ABT6F1Y1_9SYNE|nr:RodZ domain-containing protein [Candidatus Synechococcus calcipolaris]MDG2991870.1 DUF4115 domain-containing protein [Candidatus Synechococcus calcipolaris G9]
MPNLNHLDQDRAAKLAEIGAFLQEKRQELGLPLDEIAAKTMIRQSILEAIEAGTIAHLPEPIYTQGFIRRFADALGLEGKVIASEYPTETHVYTVEQKKESPRRLSTPQLRPIHLYLAYFFLVIGSVAALAYIFKPTVQGIADGDTAPDVTATPEASPSPAATTFPETVQNSPSPSPESSPPLADQPVQVDVTLEGDSWIEVEVDGTMVFVGMMETGSEQTWKGKERIIVRSGNAGAVNIAYNNNPAEKMGALGDVEVKEYGPSGSGETSVNNSMNNQATTVPDSTSSTY